MKHLKTYQLFESKTGLTPEQEAFLNRFTRGSWTYNPATGLVDVNGDFDCSEKGLKTLRGIKFGKVGGDFDCQDNNLTSLEGAPQKVGGSFSCSSNNLTSLEGAPQEVGGNFKCSSNNLTSLEGAPQEVGGDFSCWENNLTSLEGAPQEVGGYFGCNAFKLEKGQWNPKGWLKVLKEGNLEAQKLILTILSPFPEVLNKEIQQDPAGMAMKLKVVWNDKSFRETRDQLVWPKGYQDQADLVGDLDDIGF
jgi:hypothetical protein